MATKQPQAPAGPVGVRVLQDCGYGASGAYAEIPADELEGAKAAGLVDDHADAVAYAKSLTA
jgi:hypothetical protein